MKFVLIFVLFCASQGFCVRGDLYTVIKNSIQKDAFLESEQDTTILDIMISTTKQQERQTKAQESIAQDTRINSYIWRSLLVVGVLVWLSN